jgi:hypothetical protein
VAGGTREDGAAFRGAGVVTKIEFQIEPLKARIDSRDPVTTGNPREATL